MLAHLPLESVYPEGGRLLHDAGAYQRAGELLADLQLLYESLIAVGAWRVADEAVGPVIRTVQTFGFHLAVAGRSPEQPFPRSGDGSTAGRGGIRRAADYPRTGAKTGGSSLLNRELASPRPFLRADTSAGPEADAVLRTYRLWSSTCAATAPTVSAR